MPVIKDKHSSDPSPTINQLKQPISSAKATKRTTKQQPSQKTIRAPSQKQQKSEITLLEWDC